MSMLILLKYSKDLEFDVHLLVRIRLHYALHYLVEDL